MRLVDERTQWAERHIAWMRLLVIASAWAMFPWMVAVSISKEISFAILGGGLVYSVALYALTHRRRPYPVRHASTAFALVDLLFALASVATTGGIYSPVLPLLYLVTFSFGFRHPPRKALSEGALSCLGYFAVVAGLGQLSSVTLVSAHLVDLVLSVVLTSFVSREALAQRHERAKLEQLSVAQLDTEARLRRSEAALVEAQRLARVGSWEWAEDGKASASHELLRMLGVTAWPTPNELLARHVPDEDRALVVGACSKAFAAGTGFDVEHRLLSASGETRWVRSIGRTVPESEGVPRRLVGVLQDITELKRAHDDRISLAQESAARAAAEEAIRARDDFLSIAAHELRTPLTSLKLELQLLARATQALPGGAAEEALWPRIAKVNRQVGRLTGLVQNLLDVSRIVSGRLEIRREWLDLGELVRQAAQGAQEQFAKARSSVRVEAEAGIVGLWDRMRLEQVLDNLLSNAAKYGAGQPVELSVGSRAGEAWLRVRDHGIGIAKHDQWRIFERFERAVPNRHFGGMGLGLWIVRQIVEAMGGSITVSSELGRGSTFEVRLPHDQPVAEQPVAARGLPSLDA